jgi:primosomal protein N' (replication factor Y)
MIRVEVAVAAPLDQSLAYDLADDTPGPWGADQSPVGRRVLVPLGGRSITGYVLAVLPDEEVAYTVRRVLKVLDRIPLFHENLLPFFRWASTYYHYPLGQVIKTALPAGLAPKSVREILLVEGKKEALLASFSEQPPAWADLLAGAGRLSAVESSLVLGRRAARKNIDLLRSEGILELQETVSKDAVREKMETCFSLSPDLQAFPAALPEADEDDERIEAWCRQAGLSLKLSEKKTLAVLVRLALQGQGTDVPAKELYRLYAGARKAIPALLSQGLVGQLERRIFRNPFGEPVGLQKRPERLTDEQEVVLSQIVPALAAGKYTTFLLHGITGCGKTEVYLRAAEETLARGRDVLVLVPEIALATQLEEHFLSRFGEAVVLLHSGLTTAERFDQWFLALTGRAKIVIGARSALFAPLKDPGLIVVDEEHDAGFKQDDSFRYHGRDLAVLRGRCHEAVVLLGSATPSVTSSYHARTGKYTLLQMTRRVGERALPSVTIVDLSRKKSGEAKGLFRQELRQALAENLEKGQQSVLLLNRRGFSSVMLCQDCGAPVECLHCRVSLTLHKARKRLICHYCGYTVDHRVICSNCHSTGSLVPVGFGTERVEEEARLLLPEARIARLDSDTAADRRTFLQILKAMRARQIDVLIGTQMIAKGHHFPHVTLVGVVWADGGLNMPDFRAAEKTFQLITQVTGRAGRGEEPGRVIIQTMRPDHYAIRFAQQHQYEELYQHELQIRRSPAFPPFVRLVALHIQGEREADVRGTAENIADCCRREARQRMAAIETLGPAPAPLERLKRNYRWQVLLKAANLDDLHLICRYVHENRQGLAVGGSRIAIDVDPENMM